MKKILAAMVVIAGSAFAQYPDYAGAPGYGPPADAYAAQGACGPGYVWIDGYTDASGAFVNGYCTVPPYAGAYWIGPSFVGGRYIGGYWGHGGYGYRAGVYGVRGGYRGGYNGGYNGGYRAGSRVERGYGNGNGFRSPAAAAPSVHSQGAYRGGGSAIRGGSSGMRGGGSGHGGRR